MVQGFESWETIILQPCEISFQKILLPFTFLTVHPQDIFNLANTDIQHCLSGMTQKSYVYLKQAGHDSQRLP